MPKGIKEFYDLEKEILASAGKISDNALNNELEIAKEIVAKETDNAYEVALFGSIEDEDIHIAPIPEHVETAKKIEFGSASEKIKPKAVFQKIRRK